MDEYPHTLCFPSFIIYHQDAKVKMTLENKPTPTWYHMVPTWYPGRCVLPLGPAQCVCCGEGEEGHWPASYRSGTCCGGTRAALLERNGRMSDQALGSPQAVEHCSAWSLSGWQLPAREGCQVGCDSCAVHNSPRFFGALPFLTCLSATRGK